MISSRGAFFGAAAVSVAVVGSALAQPAAQEKAAAEALFQQGIQLIGDGQLAEGCDKLAASQKLEAAVGTALRLGDCHERLGRTASAWAMFVEASSQAQREGQLARKEAADLRVAALRPQLSTITVNRAVDVPEGLVVLRDGSPLPPAAFGTAVPLDPGSHVIEASAPGHQSWSETVELAGSASQHVVQIPPLAALPHSEPATTPPQATDATRISSSQPGEPLAQAPGEPIRIAGFVAGGLGVAGVVVGSIFGLLAKSANDDSMDFCRTDTLCSADGVDLRETAQGQATVSTVGFVAGGALLAAGIVMVIVAPEESGSQEVAVDRSWMLVPRLGPGELGLGVRGHWQ